MYQLHELRDRLLDVRRFVVAALLLATACSGSMQYKNDHRIAITAPKNRSDVSVPFTVRWTYKDFRVTGATPAADRTAGYFAVFIDRSPMPAGQDMRWLARSDRSCAKTQGCPDAQYLADHHVFTTSDPQLTVSTLPSTNIRTATERHEVTVVLLDGTGHRIGESAWYVAVNYKRKRNL
jgi:hypothetical protein